MNSKSKGEERGLNPHPPFFNIRNIDLLTLSNLQSCMNDQYFALAELAGGFIHEFKNHLSTLGLNLQLLAEDFAEPENQRERRAYKRVQRLQGDCERLVQVANDFLRFARINELDTAPTDVVPVIEEMVDFFQPSAMAANITVRTFLLGALPQIMLDRDLFKQALLNLLVNATQAMPDGGDLTIQAECENDEAVTLCLIDTGKGMSADVMAKIFRPFFSTRNDGSGLGLPTTGKIVEAHGGTITVESEIGRGTKFTLRFPIAQPAYAESSRS